MTTVTSTFDKSAEGWKISGDPASSGWKNAGGDPGGYFSWVDAATGSDSYFQAPARFLGKKGAFFGGTLTYSVLDTGNDYTAYDVKLVGAGHTLEFTGQTDAHFPKPGVWSTRTVHLNPLQFVDADTGKAPSAAELRAVLADLTELDIRAEYVSGDESGGLDNVSFTSRPAPGAALVHAAASFAPSHLGGADSDALLRAMPHTGSLLAPTPLSRLHAVVA